jgi:hypothetical protein
MMSTEEKRRNKLDERRGKIFVGDASVSSTSETLKFCCLDKERSSYSNYGNNFLRVRYLP